MSAPTSPTLDTTTTAAGGGTTTTTTTRPKNDSRPVLLTPPPEGWQVNPQTGQFDDRENLAQLTLLVAANPVLRIIQAAGARTAKRLLFPGDSSCEYYYEYLSAFPEGTWALPQVFCRVIKGLNSNHWLALTAMRFRERRHLAEDNKATAGYGMLRPAEVERLRQCNRAFFEHFVQVRPDDHQLEKLKQRSQARKFSASNANSKTEEGGNKDDLTTTAKSKTKKRKSLEPMSSTNANVSESNTGTTTTTTSLPKKHSEFRDIVLPLKKRVRLLQSNDSHKTTENESSHGTSKIVDTVATPPPPTRVVVPVVDDNEEDTDEKTNTTTTTREWNTDGTGQIVDRNDLEQLQALVMLNPVLEYIQEHGGKTPKRALFPGDSTCDYFFEYLENLPTGVWALPQAFCRVIKGLNSNHWLALTAMRFRDRRHHGEGPYGSLRTEEVERLQACNMAFYKHFIDVPPGNHNHGTTNQRHRVGSTGKKTNLSSSNNSDEEESVEHPPSALSDEDSSSKQENKEQPANKDNKNFSILEASALTSLSGASTNNIIPDPILQRQLLQEHLLRAGMARLLPSQQDPRLQLSSLLGAAAPPTADSYARLVGNLPHVLPSRDVLPFLAANLTALDQANPNRTETSFQTLAAFLGGGVTHNTYPRQQTTTSKSPFIVGTSMQMNPPSSALPEDDAESSHEQQQQAEEPPREGPVKNRDFSMLDILATTASAARMELVAEMSS
eukprot:scaffold3973_cov161-Amphora_coffeaeformis.AAC.13